MLLISTTSAAICEDKAGILNSHEGLEGKITSTENAAINTSTINCNISGIVTNAENGQPINNAVVSLISTGRVDSTNNSGQFRFDSVSTGQYDFFISHYHFIDTTIIGVELNGDSATMNIQLSPACCKFIIGDFNDDGMVWPSDVTYGIKFFKHIGPEPPYSCFLDSQYEVGFCLYAAGDANGNCECRGSDISRLVAYFKGQAQLATCSWLNYCLGRCPI